MDIKAAGMWTHVTSQRVVASRLHSLLLFARISRSESKETEETEERRGENRSGEERRETALLEDAALAGLSSLGLSGLSDLSSAYAMLRLGSAANSFSSHLQSSELRTAQIRMRLSR